MLVPRNWLEHIGGLDQCLVKFFYASTFQISGEEYFDNSFPLVGKG